MVEVLKKQAGDHGWENVPGKMVQPEKSNLTRGNATGTLTNKLPTRKTGQEGMKCFVCEEFGHIKKYSSNKGTAKRVVFCREDHKSSAEPRLAEGVRRRGW